MKRFLRNPQTHPLLKNLLRFTIAKGKRMLFLKRLSGKAKKKRPMTSGHPSSNAIIPTNDDLVLSQVHHGKKVKTLFPNPPPFVLPNLLLPPNHHKRQLQNLI